MLEVNELIGFGAGSSSEHKHWRLYFIAPVSGGYASAWEIEMRAISGGSDQCNGGTVTASSYAGTDTPSKAFDNVSSFSNKWMTPAPLANQWIAYEFLVPVSIAELWYMPHYFGSLVFGPSEFAIEHSDNGSDWARLKTFSGLSWTPGEAKTLSVE